LGKACKQHDISYSQKRDNLDARHAAGRILAQRAWERVIAKDASLGEKAAAWEVTNAMKAKTKLGKGLKKKIREKPQHGNLRQSLKRSFMIQRSLPRRRLCEKSSMLPKKR